jgi:hypothetical protein
MLWAINQRCCVKKTGFFVFGSKTAQRPIIEEIEALPLANYF